MSAAVSNNKLYEKVDDTRLELKGDIVRLEAKVETIVNVELAKVKDDLSNLKIKYATLATKLGVLGFVSASVIGAVVSVIVNKLAT